jgi:hypothetical protein
MGAENRRESDRLRGLSTRQPLVGKTLVATFADREVLRGQHNESPRPYSQLSRSEPLLSLLSSSSAVLTRLSGPRSRPTTSQKIW